MKAYVNHGKLIPDEIVIEALLAEISRQKSKSILINGFPRTLSQAQMLETVLGEIELILGFVAPEAVLVQRLKKKSEAERSEGDMETLIKKRFEEYNEKSLPTIAYYTQLGKVRVVDSAGTIPAVYQLAVKAITPETIMVIGPKAGGKTAVSHFLEERRNMRYVNFREFAEQKGVKLIPDNSELVVRELIKEMHTDPSTKLVLDGFPTHVSQLKYYLSNVAPPLKILYVKASESSCLKYNEALGPKHSSHISPPELCKRIKEFYDTSKEIIAFCNTRGLLKEIDNCEGKVLEHILESSAESFHPEILLARFEGGAEAAVKEMVKKLSTEHGYTELNARSLCNEEVKRKTLVGKEVSQYISQKARIPSECFVKILHKTIYSSSGNMKFVLSDFPEKIEDLRLFEKACGKISREFYFTSEIEARRLNYLDYTMETVMQKENRLTFMKDFSYDLMESYSGTQLQYVLISGPPLSGYGEIAKRIEKYGFTYLDIVILTEELKKKLNPEENTGDPINPTFEQVLEELKRRTVGRKEKKEKFVLDGLPFESVDSIKKMLAKIGLPAHYIELSCEEKELKKRYAKKNDIPAELNEEQLKEYQKTLEPFAAVQKELAKIEGNSQVHHHSIKTDSGEATISTEVKRIFESKLILIRHDSGIAIDTILTNLSIRSDFIFLNVPFLIQQEIEQKTELGVKMARTKKPKDTLEDCKWSIDSRYCSIHFDLELVMQLLVKSIKRVRSTQQLIVIEGFLSTQKLVSWEDKQQFRAMDELMAIEKEIGEVKAIINLTKGEIDTTEDDRVAEKAMPPSKAAVAAEKPKEGGGEEAAPPEKVQDNEGS